MECAQDDITYHTAVMNWKTEQPRKTKRGEVLLIRSRKQIIRRIISSLICLFVVILINFFLPRIMPGNPVLMLTGQDESSMSEEGIEGV